MTILAAAVPVALILSLGLAAPAVAQSPAAGAHRMQAGYGDARTAVATPATGSTRDPHGNRLIVNGLIQPGASAYSSSSGGVARAWSGVGGQTSATQLGGAAAIGNQLNVVVTGSRNTVIVNSTQTNSGAITAGTVLNGTLNLP